MSQLQPSSLEAAMLLPLEGMGNDWLERLVALPKFQPQSEALVIWVQSVGVPALSKSSSRTMVWALAKAVIARNIKRVKNLFIRMNFGWVKSFSSKSHLVSQIDWITLFFRQFYDLGE